MNAGRQRYARAGLSALAALALVAVLGAAAPPAEAKASPASAHSAHTRHAVAPTPQQPRPQDLHQLDATAPDSAQLAMPSLGSHASSSWPAATGVNAYPAQRGRGPPAGHLA